MPVYAQLTEFNDRVTSLMSAVLYNTNHFYSANLGENRSRDASGQRERPLFAEAILRKARALRELESLSQFSGSAATRTVQIVLIRNPTDESHVESSCNLIADLISQLFSMPEDGSGIRVWLQIDIVRSHSIRNDLVAADRYNGSATNASMHGRRRMFVALGSAIQGLCHYLSEDEIESSHGLQYQQNLGIVCVDPPPDLWNSCIGSLRNHSHKRTMPLLVVGYENEEKLNAASRGDLLRDLRCLPLALVVIAHYSARIGGRVLGSSKPGQNGQDGENRYDACFWFARLVTKYAEALLHLQSPPGKQIHQIELNSISRVMGRSKL